MLWYSQGRYSSRKVREMLILGVAQIKKLNTNSLIFILFFTFYRIQAASRLPRLRFLTLLFCLLIGGHNRLR